MRRKLGGDDRRGDMNLGARVAGDQPDDPLDLRRIAATLPVSDAAGAKPVEPERAIGIDHDLDHERIGERGGDVGAHRGAQHRALRGLRDSAALTGPLLRAGESDRPLASCWPTRSTNAAKRSRPIARATSSPSGSGALTVSM